MNAIKLAAQVARHNKRAKALGLPATLTTEEWTRIVRCFRNCAYCNNPLSDGRGLYLEHVISLSDPNSPGTTAINSLPVCKMCNPGKRNRDLLTFIEWDSRATRLCARLSNYYRREFGERGLLMCERIDALYLQSMIRSAARAASHEGAER